MSRYSLKTVYYIMRGNEVALELENPHQAFDILNRLNNTLYANDNVKGTCAMKRIEL